MSFDIAGYGSWTLTPFGRKVLKGAARVELRRAMPLQTRSSRAERKSRTPSTQLDGADKELWERLRSARQTLAQKHRVAAYVIFADRSLLDMVHLKPGTREQMRLVHGVGEAKLERYGDIFLNVIREHNDSAHSNS
jgi:ATP-dependent DNA helicase RecQ